MFGVVHRPIEFICLQQTKSRQSIIYHSPVGKYLQSLQDRLNVLKLVLTGLKHQNIFHGLFKMAMKGFFASDFLTPLFNKAGFL